jgi:hypothetical protein
VLGVSFFPSMGCFGILRLRCLMKLYYTTLRSIFFVAALSWWGKKLYLSCRLDRMERIWRYFNLADA